MTRWIAAAFLVACAWLAVDHFVFARPIARGPGVVAAREPVQQLMARDAPVFAKDGFRVAALASFELEARVLRSKNYCCGGPDRLAPVDVALGWGRMSDEAVLERIDVSQSGRFYYWRYEGAAPIPHREIELSSANMHLIPATKAIEKRLKKLRPGNIVVLKGYLVDVQGERGFRW
ncbi:MAG: hypothetical protein ACM36B_07320, partial [Bacteroidota bacterium]